VRRKSPRLKPRLELEYYPEFGRRKVFQ